MVTEQAALSAGTNGTLTICSSETLTDALLFAALGGAPDTGGTWSPVLAGAGTYTYTIAASGSCAASSAEVAVTVETALDPGTNGTLTICSSETLTDALLFAALGGTPAVGGTWSPALAGAGTYTYTLAATAECPAVTSQVAVTVETALDPGTNGTLTICSSETLTDALLFAALGGTPAVGGTWSPALAGAGTYTYTLAATAECPAVTSQVAVTVETALDPGTNGTLTICSSETLTDALLFAALGGTPAVGGTWSPALAGAGTYTYTLAATAECPAVTSQVAVTVETALDPGTNGTLTICSSETLTDALLFAALGGTPAVGGTWSPALAGAGTYTYTLAATAECPAVTSQVAVTVETALDPGTNGTLTICSSETLTDALLFAALGGTPAVGGTWSPALAGAGTYTYTLAATAECPAVTSQVAVTVETALDPGTNGTLTICSSETLTDALLFAALGGTPAVGGTWSPALAGAGTYTYTLAATAECPAVTSQVAVTVETALDPGTNGTLTICSSETLTDALLFAALGGTPAVGGTWSPALAGAGTYTYTLAATAECPAVTSQVAVTVETALDPGTNGTLTICSSETLTDALLFAELGGTPAVGGTWSPVLAGAGTYTYTLAATAECPAVTSQVAVTVETALDPGTNGTLTICSSETLTDALLFAALGGTPAVGGTWSPALAGAGTYTYTLAATAECPAVTSQVAVTVETALDPGTNGTLTICSSETLTDALLFAALGGTPAVGGTWSPALAGAGTYTYTLAATAECPAVTSQVAVTVETALDPGTNGTLTICSSETLTDALLFAALGGTPAVGGTWSPALAGAGTYTYTLAATAECPAVTSQVAVTVETALDPGTNGTLTICSSETLTDALLFAALGGTPAVGGTWSPALAGAGTYTYTLAATAECPAVTSQVAVTVETALDPGTNGTLTICSSETLTDALLFAALGGTPAVGGTWSPALAGAGTYTYTLAATAECPAVTSQVAVTVETALDPGTNGTLTICSSETLTDALLFAALGGTPAVGGTWSPALAGAGTYTYTLAATAECPAVTSQVAVTVETALDPGTNGTLTICSSETLTDALLFAALGGTPAVGGTWSPALAGAGTYTYTLAATAECPAVTSQVAVTVETALDPGTNGTLTICSSETLTDALLFAALGGTPAVGGTWSPALAGAGTYTYTLAATAECPAVTSQVAVTVETALDPGTNGTLTICSSETLTDALLFAALGGTPAVGGTWSPALAGAGTYTYTLAATAECPAVTSQVAVTVETALDPGTNGTLTICSSETLTDALLFAELGGTPAVGGTWSPALAGAGTYTYTLAATQNVQQ